MNSMAHTFSPITVILAILSSWLLATAQGAAAETQEAAGSSLRFGVSGALAADATMDENAATICSKYMPARVNTPLRSTVRKRITLDGQWQFDLDPRESGLDERWFDRTKRFSSNAVVPGCWQAQGFGTDEPAFVRACGDFIALKTKASYNGTGWYQKRFFIPREWEDKLIWLKFGGVHPSARIWLNGRFVGSHDFGSFIPFKFDVTELVSPNADNVLTVMISMDNGLGELYDWVARWGGIYRSVELEATAKIWLEDVYIIPQLSANEAEIRATVVNGTGAASGKTLVRVAVGDNKRTVSVAEKSLILAPGKTHVVLVAPIAQPELWSPDTPFLYVARIALAQDSQEIDALRERFGMREFAVKDKKILLNGRPVFLRGYGDDCVYPITVCPNVDRSTLKKRLMTAKQYGFNYVRHHTHVPPPEYLDVADEVGLLVQEEVHHGPRSRRAAIERQWRNVILRDRNHPSLMTYCMGNEIYSNDPALVAWLDDSYKLAKRLDATRLVLNRGGSNLSNVGNGKTDFIELSCGVPTAATLERILDSIQQPVVIHEFGYWSSYPNPALKRKYEGCGMRPYWITHAENVATERGMAHLLPTYVRNSEQLQAIGRKTGIEEVRHSSELAGYSLWMGKDTVWAVEGIWDDFGDPKNVSARRFLQTNDGTVLLVRLDGNRRTLQYGERYPLRFSVSHYGLRDITDAAFRWRVTLVGKPFVSGKETRVSAARGTVSNLGKFTLTVPNGCSPAKLELKAELETRESIIANEWNVWAFPKPELSSAESERIRFHLTGAVRNNVQQCFPLAREWNKKPDALKGKLLVTDRVTPALVKHLAAGGRALIAGSGAFPELTSSFRGIRYNGFSVGNSGTIVERHAALGDFPHDGFGDRQFEFLLRTPCVNLDIWPAHIQPIIRSIGSYKKCRNRAYLFEIRAGAGGLMVCCLNFARTLRNPESAYLFKQLLEYAISDSFSPTCEIELSALDRYLPSDNVAHRLEEGPCSWEAAVAWEGGNPAAYTADGDVDTYWSSWSSRDKSFKQLRGRHFGYKWPKATKISGVKVHYLYCVPAEGKQHVEYWDGTRWRNVAGATVVTEEEPLTKWRYDFKPVVTTRIRIVIEQLAHGRTREPVSAEVPIRIAEFTPIVAD